MLKNKALVVLNIGEKSLCTKSRESFKHATDRWNCDFIEICESLYDCHHYWQKMFVRDYLESQYLYILQLDADMLIRSDTPNPFNLLEDYTIAAVKARQHEGMRNIINYREKSINYWSKQANLKPCPDDKHLNAGFLLYNTQKSEALFDFAKKIGQNNEWRSRLLPEQATLSVVIDNLQIPTLWLDKTWNSTYPQWSKQQMINYIYHFTGHNNKEIRINAVEWRV